VTGSTSDLPRVTVRCYAELVELAGDREVEVVVGAPRSVKDVVESIGVPHPEVAHLRVDGVAVGFDHRLVGGERVAVYPPFRTLADPVAPALAPPWPEPRRFVLDVHLGTLTRRLRLLGFDCWYRTRADDLELARVSVAEDRILLTRDRGLLMRREVVHGYCPRSDDPDRQATEVVDRFGLRERAAPLTRCVRCNGRLRSVPLAEVAAEVPPRSRAAFDRFARCEDCGQVFWPGSHVEDLADFLDRNGGAASPTGPPPSRHGPRPADSPTDLPPPEEDPWPRS
jgi:uncharacterized protein